MSLGIAQEWRTFRHDSPGKRFCNHYQRMRQGSRGWAIVRMALGVLLVAVGIILLFIPGPGLLFVLFGFGLLGGQSKLISRTLDRIEPAMRRWWRKAKRWWTARSMVVQDVMIAASLIMIGGACYGAWRVWFA